MLHLLRGESGSWKLLGGGVLTNEQVFHVLMDRLICKFIWAALVGLSELPHIKHDMKLEGAHCRGNTSCLSKKRAEKLVLYFPIWSH